MDFYNIMTQFINHSVELHFVPDQNHSRTHRTPKPSQFHSRRLAGIHHRQAVHQKKPRNSYQFASPGGIGLHRQAVPRGNPETPNF